MIALFAAGVLLSEVRGCRTVIDPNEGYRGTTVASTGCDLVAGDLAAAEGFAADFLPFFAADTVGVLFAPL